MQAYLILENGTVLTGKSVGAAGTAIGEVDFTTGVVGFQEDLTDPAHYGCMILQTYPLVGNYGMNSEDVQSDKVWCNGYIVREACTAPSNFRSETTLDAFLKAHGTVAIEGVDTRALTRLVRDNGVMNAAITTEFDPAAEPEKLAALLEQVRAYRITGAVSAVTCAGPRTFHEEGDCHVAVLDLGCTNSTVWALTERGCKVTLLPAQTTAAQLAALKADGLLLSSGPADPAENAEIVVNVRGMLDSGIPAFGIDLGHLTAALAAGARTFKLKTGHRGGQAVTDLRSGRTYSTSQSHGYAVDGASLPADMGKVSYVNVTDKTCEGVEYTRWNCETVQFHPESGVQDTTFLLDRFVERVRAAKGGN